MSRLVKTGLSLVSLRRTLGFGNIYRAVKFDLQIDKNPKLDFARVLILAPHPDDDVFAMGGTIKKMTTAGVKVTVAYFCDGSGGTVEGRGEGEEMGLPSLKKDENLIGIRKKEAQGASQILGVNDLIFWGYPDGKLASGTSAVKALKDLILKVKPNIIFLPSFLDNHGDHRVVNEILFNAGRNLAEMKNLTIWAYEMWTPIYINRLVDITLYIKTKQEAILAHQSQIAARRYDKATLGLNQYRAEINKLSGYAEGFFAAPFEVYKSLYEKS